tara:strand:+ start:724 stop:927 length:204 start_codon:yes stop_codon:yes gene_type:complete
MKMKEVFIAKNGTPYVKDENGKVRFISNAEWEQHKMEDIVTNNLKYGIIGIAITCVTIYMLIMGDYL